MDQATIISILGILSTVLTGVLAFGGTKLGKYRKYLGIVVKLIELNKDKEFKGKIKEAFDGDVAVKQIDFDGFVQEKVEELKEAGQEKIEEFMDSIKK